MTKAIEIFEQQIKVYENMFNLNLKGNTTHERLESFLETLDKEDAPSEIIRTFAQNVSVFHVKNITELGEVAPNEFRRIAAITVFSQFIQGAAHKYRAGQEPKLHHWLPASYIRRFSDVTGRRPNTVHLNKVVYTNGIPEIIKTSDREFAHVNDKKSGGFYDLRMEWFFHTIENMLGECYSIAAKDTVKSNLNLRVALASYIFYIVQSSRNPINGSFKNKSPIEIFDSMILALDYEMNPNVFIVRDMNYMVFTPHIPHRVTLGRDGLVTMTFSMDKTTAVVISNKNIGAAHARTVAVRARESMIDHARRTDGVLYGNLENSDFLFKV